MTGHFKPYPQCAECLLMVAELANSRPSDGACSSGKGAMRTLPSVDFAGEFVGELLP